MNQLLGRVALREGRLDEAKRFLLAAGASPGSPQLDSFGPQPDLARELLARGERDVVLRYLELVGAFWARDKGATPLGAHVAQANAATLERWKADIRAGRTPDDPRWK